MNALVMKLTKTNDASVSFLLHMTRQHLLFAETMTVASHRMYEYAFSDAEIYLATMFVMPNIRRQHMTGQ